MSATSSPMSSWASTEGVRRSMKANRRCDTGPELRLRSLLHSRGHRFRKDYRLDLDRLRVRIDVAFPGEARAAARPQTRFELADDKTAGDEVPDFARERMPRLSELSSDDLSDLGIETVALGRGFEERTLASAQRLSEALRPGHAVLVSYPLEGHGAEVEEVARAATDDLRIVDYREAVAEGLSFPAGTALVDVTGLAKPMIFDAVRRLLRRDGRVVVAHTAASIHYPLNDDIARVLDAHDKGDAYALLDALAAS